jgi:membrane-bound lytic murein transglycosylase D
VFDKAKVPGGTDLQELGRLIGVPYESLREWNPELRRFCTPPNRESYEIRLPKGYGKIVEEQMEEIREDARVDFLLHTVKKGETLASLAHRYHTTVPVLQELNGMKSPKMKRSARLVIPVTGLSEEEAVPGKEVSAEQVELALKRLDDVTKRTRKARLRKGSGSAKKSVAPARRGKKEIQHVIRRGDTLAKVSRTYGVTPEQLSERNRLKEGQVLPRGRVLRIPMES